MKAGCQFVRSGKGDRDVWYSPISQRRFVVDQAIKSRHTANAVLKQAGLQKPSRDVAVSHCRYGCDRYLVQVQNVRQAGDWSDAKYSSQRI